MTSYIRVPVYNMYGSGNKMCGCGMNPEDFRNFLTKEEKAAILKEYKESLEKELKGVEERIKEIQKGN
jgi:hypothetical protein